jgi:hypothetical protein
MNFYHAQRFGMRFSDLMPNANALIDAVYRHVQHHNIKLLDRRGKTKQ